jgi:DNA-binding MarR family transcriptional regulator
MNEQQPDAACFYMDIFSTHDLAAFVRLFGKTVLGQLDTFSDSILRKLTTFFRSCRPIITTDELTGKPSVTLDFLPDKSEQTLKEIFDYIKDSGKRCYIAIDEFQQIAFYPEKSTEALLRSYIQFMPNVRFIFAGSSQHLMAEMFASAKRPFYQSTQLMTLTAIDADAYYSFAKAFFEESDSTLQRETFDVLYRRFEGHTWYVQTILNRLYERKQNIPDMQVVKQLILDVIEENTPVYQNLTALLTDNQLSLIHAIACEGKVEAPNSGDFIRKYALKSPSSVNVALKSLQDKELIYKRPDGYMVYDRFMSIWLQRL